MKREKVQVRFVKYLSDGSGIATGLDRHYLNLRKVLDANCIESDTLEFGAPAPLGFKHIVKEVIVNPLLNLLRGRGGTEAYHATYEMLGAFFPFVRAKRIVSIHHVVNKEERNKGLWYLLWRISACISIRFADRILAISSKTKDDVIKRYGILPDKITVVTFPQDSMYRVLGVEKGKVLGSMGVLTSRKNHQVAIRVFSEVLKTPGNEDCVLRIVGKGPSRNELEELVSELGISDKVSFESDLSPEEMVEFYNTCAVVLNTSSKEGLGLATLEAQACGTPVVFFRDADLPAEVMEAAVPCADEPAMVEEVVRILNDPDYADNLIRNGLEFTSKDNGYRESVLRLYDWS